MARPTKLTPDLRTRICDYLRNGVTQEAAALASGISTTTYFRWLADAEKPKAAAALQEFRDAVDEARGEAEASYALVIRRAAIGGDVRAAMWWLDRARPERWAARQTLALVGKDDGAVEIDVTFGE